MVFTLCASGAIINEAGANVNINAASSAIILEQCSNNAEGDICTATRYDWVTNYGAITSFAKFTLASVASALGGISLIKYDMESIGRNEAQARINVLYDRATNGINYLKQMKRPEVEF